MSVDILNQANQILSVSKSNQEISDTEIYFERHTRQVLRLMRGELKISEVIQEGGGAVRTFLKHKVGFSTFTMASQGASAINRAYKIAKASKPNPYDILPSPKSISSQSSAIDKALQDLSPSNLTDILVTIRDTQNASEIHSRNATIKIIQTEKTLVNSNGIECEHKDLGLSLEIECNAKKEDVSSLGYYGTFIRKRSDLPSITDIALATQEDAIIQLDKQKISTKSMNLILHPFAGHELFSWAMVPGLLGHNVLKNASPFQNQLGKFIANDILTIEDQGLSKQSIYSTPFDDEGNPRQNTTVINNGLLTNFLYDEKTAKEANEKVGNNHKQAILSTGNSGRYTSYKGRGYMFPPTITSNEFFVKPTSTTLDEIMAETKEGLYVVYPIGTHSANSASGSFNIVPFVGYLIKNGERVGGIKEAIISSTIPEILKKISLIGNDPSLTQITWNHPVTTPHLYFSDVKIVGE